MNAAPVIYAVDDGVALITLNRPDRLNAITAEMAHAYASAMHDANVDRAVRAIVVTGAGRGFCSGADLSVLAQGPDALDSFTADQPFDSLPTCALATVKPVVMAVNGAAAGLGFVLALSGDVCFASPQARFISAFSRLGLVAEYAVGWLLPRQIGRQRAAEILMSGRCVDAQEAHRIGMVHAIDDDVVGAAMMWAIDVATHCSPASLATMKRQLDESSMQTLADSMADSLRLMSASFRQPDLAEALIAKAEGRPPNFAQPLVEHPCVR